TLSGSADAFVTKVAATGSALVYSTYMGRGPSFGIAIDVAGNGYVTAPLFYVTKLDATGSTLVYSINLGGARSPYGVAVDTTGHAYATGFVYSYGTLSTTAGTFQTTFG